MKDSQSGDWEDVKYQELPKFKDLETEGEEFETQSKLNSDNHEQNLNSLEDGIVNDIFFEDEDDEFGDFYDKISNKFHKGRSEKSSFQSPRVSNNTKTNVTLLFGEHLEDYWLELYLIFCLFAYFLNFLKGQEENTRLANAWFQTHKSLLDDNFSIVGDNGKLEPDSPGLIKERQNQFKLWCSGRTCCEGMLVELKFLKRQDLFAVITGIMRSTMDQVHIKVIMNKEDMDTFLFCTGSKKIIAKLCKEMKNLNIVCAAQPGEKYGLPSTYQVLSEIREVTMTILNSHVTSFINKYPNQVEYMHFTDQYSSNSKMDKKILKNCIQNMKFPETQRVLLFGFNIPVKRLSPNEAMEAIKEQMFFVFYCIEKIKQFRLSEAGKCKADKNRILAEEDFLIKAADFYVNHVDFFVNKKC